MEAKIVIDWYEALTWRPAHRHRPKRDKMVFHPAASTHNQTHDPGSRKGRIPRIREEGERNRARRQTQAGRSAHPAGAHRTARRGLPLALGVCLTLAGCVDPGIRCATRSDYEVRGKTIAHPIEEIEAGVYEGEVVTDDPANWWTGARFTGNTCRIVVEHTTTGTYVKTEFLVEPVRLRARIGGRDSPFFSGETNDDEAVVLQHHRGQPVSVTLTRYEDDGTLRFGGCGERDAPFLECHRGIPRTGNE